jgi:hypothetical protein
MLESIPEDSLEIIPEDSLAQIAWDVHMDYGNRFSVAVEDIPPLTFYHVDATGLGEVKRLLSSVQKKGDGYADLCRSLRNRIACNLKDRERASLFRL